VVAEDCIVLVPGGRLLAMVRQLFELYSEDALDRQSRLCVDEWRAAEISRYTPGVRWEPPPALAELVRSLDEDFAIAPQPAPPGMSAVLRIYQEYGVGWLRFLDDHRLGGILADDMGLGKTIQVMALLQAAKNAGRLDLPALVVAPVSVLPNWGNELRRFAPGLKVVLLHGGERHRHWEELSGNDVVLTSYALLRLDIRMFASHPFSFVILDEAQVIKNPKAQVARAACLVNGRTRLCLTGTPVENHLGDLWSLMHFALPGVLGRQDRFEQCFRRPIERDRHPVMLSLLQRRVTPLILRRTKSAVAADLPAKTEIIQTIPLSDIQHDLYQAVRLAMTERIRLEMETKGLERSRIIVLDALLKLRQICCDPRLRDRRRTYDMPADSGKLAWLANALPEMVEEGRRILLFSQFTSMLDLIRLQLQEARILFVEIRGSTKDRETPVRQFQEGQVPVFLLSLKAGGTGLNLTAADTVIHYDPWWNPAVEAQATDRAHRIGQDKPVFVYKLVTEKTVEERILELQKSKRSLSDLISTSAGDSLAFTKKELDALLAPVLEG
jgi:SNF2 family DNA or RNA helicase